jgi:hypothetical protein
MSEWTTSKCSSKQLYTNISYSNSHSQIVARVIYFTRWFKDANDAIRSRISKDIQYNGKQTKGQTLIYKLLHRKRIVNVIHACVWNTMEKYIVIFIYSKKKRNFHDCIDQPILLILATSIEETLDFSTK